MIRSKFLALAWVILLAACASKPGKLSVNPPRNPAEIVEGQNLTLKCAFDERIFDIYKISADGQVQYHLENSELPMMIERSAIKGNWLSENTFVLNGRWFTDSECSDDKNCEYEYFTIYFNLKAGTAHEITSKLLFPDDAWTSTSKMISCQVVK